MSNRGFTVIELITSTAIMIVAVAATTMMLIEGQRFTRNSEEIIASNEGSRVAGEFIVSALRIAGMGGAGGVWINNAGVPRLISPIFGTDNISTEGSTDDIWMLIPDRRAFQDNSCQSGSGGAVSIVTAGTGPLNVSCTQSLLPSIGPNPAMLLVTSFNGPSVLLTQPSVTTVSDGTVLGLMGYNESGLPGFPPRSFQVGDLVIGLSAMRFFVHQDATGSNLYREMGVLSGASPPSWVANSVTRILLQRNIEDLQLAYGTDPTNSNLPDQYVYSNGFADAAGLPLRAVRVSVVATSNRTLLGSSADISLASSSPDGGFPNGPPPTLISQPISLENHTVTAPMDAFRRSVYTRRVELPNLNTSSL